jgi:hypothetical protein
MDEVYRIEDVLIDSPGCCEHGLLVRGVRCGLGGQMTRKSWRTGATDLQ